MIVKCHLQYDIMVSKMNTTVLLSAFSKDLFKNKWKLHCPECKAWEVDKSTALLKTRFLPMSSKSIFLNEEFSLTLSLLSFHPKPLSNKKVTVPIGVKYSPPTSLAMFKTLKGISSGHLTGSVSGASNLIFGL